MSKKVLLAAILGSILTSTASAGTYEWTSGWGMGITEHLVDDGNGNKLNISCPDEEDDPRGAYVSAYATIAGQHYSSNDGAGFDVVVDGIRYDNPFFTACRACGAAFPGFWQALRKANNLQISAAGKTVMLPTKHISTVLLPLDHQENSCRSEW